MKKIYLAARYSRRLELCNYRERLEAMGHIVMSRWLNGSHQIADNGTPIGDDGESLIEADGTDSGAESLRQRFAIEDTEDVVCSDLVISFTEKPRSYANRGGRHVEFGIAWATRKRLFVVGYRENLFHFLPRVEFFSTFDAAVDQLRAEIDREVGPVCC